MKFLFLAFALLFTSQAKADIVFFDLNFSPMEIVAATAAAKARGERLHVFPQRSAEQHKEIDRYYRLVHSLSAKAQKCQGGEKCDELNRQLNLAREKLDFWASQVRKVEKGELERIFSELDAKGVRITTMIFSGHSGGTGQVGGLFGGIVKDEVRLAFDRFPKLLEPIETMLLWGCYSGTLHSLNGIWRKAFPTVTVWGGFENRSPLGIRESSGKFLKSFLLAEKKLKAAKGLKEAHRVFRSLDLVAELDGTAVVRDSYFTYDQADSVEEMMKRCQAFDENMMEAFLCYDEGKAGCENPPADHRGVLRDIYNYLQVNRHCRGALLEKFPQLPSLEYLIRLIYLDNVKKNFAVHHGVEGESYRRLMSAGGGIDEGDLARFAQSTRAEDVRSFANISQALNRNGYRDLSVVDRSDWHELLVAGQASDSLKQLLGPSYFRSWDQSCVPFSWVDPGSREKDTCRLSDALQLPLSADYERNTLATLAFIRLERFSMDQALNQYWMSNGSNAQVFKEEKITHLQNSIKTLESYTDRSEAEESRLVRYREQLARVLASAPAQVAAMELQGLRAYLAYLEEQIEWSKTVPYGELIPQYLGNRREGVQYRIVELERMAKGARVQF